MQLPQIKQLDLVRPLQMYYMGQQQRAEQERQAQAMQMRQQQMQMQQQQFEQQNELFEYDKQNAEMEMQQGAVEWIDEQLRTLDPSMDDKELEESAAKIVGEGARRYVAMHPDKEKAQQQAQEAIMSMDLSAERLRGGLAGEKAPADLSDPRYYAQLREREAAGDPAAGRLADAMMEYKRPQEAEAYGVERAKGEAKVDYVDRVKKNEEIGKAQGQIATAEELRRAKGEISPEEKKLEGKSGVTGQLNSLLSHFLTLDSRDAIVNADEDSWSNLKAFLRSSAPGQIAERAIGTEDQAVRDAINQIKPLLIQNIRKATEMGARGLDSEKELQFYLQAATDETKSIQTNMAALKVLDEAYGTGDVADLIGRKVDDKVVRTLSREAKEYLAEGEEETKKGSPEQESGGRPPGAKFFGINPETGETEYFDAQGNKL